MILDFFLFLLQVITGFKVKFTFLRFYVLVVRMLNGISALDINLYSCHAHWLLGN